MDLHTLTYVIVGLTFSLYIGIAFWARAGSTKEFYVAGGDINPIHNGMATAADWMSAASFISMAGLIALIEGGLMNSGSRVAFIHTGGLPSIFAYQSDIVSSLNNLETKEGVL